MNDDQLRFSQKAAIIKSPSESPVLHVCARGLAPVIQIVGLYVFFHGHYSPGGGFQGGVLLASSLLLLRLCIGMSPSQAVLATKLGTVLSGIGVLVFFGTGVFCLIGGGNFLDYGELPIPGLSAAMLRYYGIMIIELGVIITVASTLVAIYDDLVEYHA
jgi:multicomponent Na+:H+ antiporter subunit B